MKKAEFINKVAAKSGLPKKECDLALEAILSTITEALRAGEGVNFIGFGSFTTVKRSARKAIMPGLENAVMVPESRSVRFKTGKLLKKAIKSK